MSEELVVIHARTGVVECTTLAISPSFGEVAVEIIICYQKSLLPLCSLDWLLTGR